MRRFSAVLIFAAVLSAVPAVAVAAQSACSLMTPPAAAALLGDSVQPGKAMGPACIFAHSDSEDVVISIQVVGGAGAVMFGTIISGNSSSANEPVPGLGERASFQKSQTESDLYILVRGKILMLGIRNAKNLDLKAAMIQAAKAIVARL